MKVLIAVDEPEFADLISDFVAGYTWKADTEFIVLSVVEPLKVGSIVAVLPGPIVDEMRTRNQERAQAVVAKTGHAINEALALATVSQKVLEGLPAECILDFANSWNADLIVLGSHNRPALSKIFLGSVSMAVASKAACSVMIVRPPIHNKDIESKLQTASNRKSQS